MNSQSSPKITSIAEEDAIDPNWDVWPQGSKKEVKQRRAEEAKKILM